MNWHNFVSGLQNKKFNLCSVTFNNWPEDFDRSSWLHNNNVNISSCCCFCCFHLCIKPLSSKQSSWFCNKRYYFQNVTSGTILLRCVKLMIVLTVVYDLQNLVWKSLSLLSIHPDSSFSYYCLAQVEYEPVRDMISTDISFQTFLTIP